MTTLYETTRPTEFLERGLWALGCSVLTSASFGFGDFPFGGAKFEVPMDLFLGGGCSGLIGIVGVALAAIWMWHEFWSGLRKLAAGNAAEMTDTISRECPTRYCGRNNALGVLAASLVMCFWLPIVILAPYWRPPAALAMFWVEQRRTRLQFARPTAVPISVDEHQRIASYGRWGWVLSMLAAAGWLRSLWAL